MSSCIWFTKTLLRSLNKNKGLKCPNTLVTYKDLILILSDLLGELLVNEQTNILAEQHLIEDTTYDPNT